MHLARPVRADVLAVAAHVEADSALLTGGLAMLALLLLLLRRHLLQGVVLRVAARMHLARPVRADVLAVAAHVEADPALLTGGLAMPALLILLLLLLRRRLLQGVVLRVAA